MNWEKKLKEMNVLAVEFGVFFSFYLKEKAWF